MGVEASGWLTSIGINIDDLVAYGRSKYNYTDEQIFGAIELAYNDRDSIRLDQIGHEIWARVDKTHPPDITAASGNYPPPNLESISRSIRAFVCLYAIWLIYIILKGTIL